jgi:hypothetical protein
MRGPTRARPRPKSSGCSADGQYAEKLSAVRSNTARVQTVPLPDNPSLEKLRNQARRLQRSVRAGDWFPRAKRTLHPVARGSPQ